MKTFKQYNEYMKKQIKKRKKQSEARTIAFQQLYDKLNVKINPENHDLDE